MSQQPQFRLNGSDKTSFIQIEPIEYLGSGRYECLLSASSSGFHCQRTFAFDNDEYFLVKVRTLLNNNEGEAELMAMSEDSFIRFRPWDGEQLLLTGYLVEHSQVTHSIEFAFQIEKNVVADFITKFEKMVRKNI